MPRAQPESFFCFLCSSIVHDILRFQNSLKFVHSCRTFRSFTPLPRCQRMCSWRTEGDGGVDGDSGNVVAMKVVGALELVGRFHLINMEKVAAVRRPCARRGRVLRDGATPIGRVADVGEFEAPIAPLEFEAG